MSKSFPTIAVLGASGLIGEAVATWLSREGFPVVPIARRFSATQKAGFGASAVECPIVALGTEAVLKILVQKNIEIIVNCIGVLQDGHRGDTDTVHRAFVGRLVTILGSQEGRALLVHISIPGNSDDDRTSFSRTKREAEREIAAGPVPFVILRPGFVAARAAYGGSALMRALAMLPFDLPAREARPLFMTTDVNDIARTIAFVATRWGDGDRRWSAVWDVMAREPLTVGNVLDDFRRHLGGPGKWLRLPSWLLRLGARTGDMLAHLGWSPPIRSTALEEMRRGVAGDPGPWIATTGIEPAPLSATLQFLPATVQEKWFARLYLTKPLILASLALFWVLSGLIALTIAFDAARAILTAHGFSLAFASVVTVASSVVDICVGVAIAFRKTCRGGLVVGIGVSLFYMAAAAAMTPDMWIEPLGALVKTAPAIVLMLVGLATLDDR